MKKFMALYMAPAATIAEQMKAPPAEMKAGMDAWNAWYKANGKAVAEMGAPLGKTKRVTAAGTADAKNEITGYTVVSGDSFESVAKLFKNHPHLGMKGATIDLLECMDMPGM